MRQRRRPEFDKELIGKNLKRLRMERNLTVEDVRDYLCVGSSQAIYKYEEGKNYPPSDTLLALIDLYGAELQDLVCEQLVHCGFLKPGPWILFVAKPERMELILEIVQRKPLQKA